MGNVSSRPEESAVLFLRDHVRLSIASLTVTSARQKTLLNVVPNIYPATRIIARRDIGDEGLVEYIQDPDCPPTSPQPSFLVRLSNDDELVFNFSFITRQGQSSVTGDTGATDTFINGLTFIYASNHKELDNLVTREFHADPNLHKNANVELVGDFSTGGSPSVRFEWSWKWRPPKITEDRGGGWRNTCSFVEYDQRAHRLETLATFSFWVQNNSRMLGVNKTPSPSLGMTIPTRLRVPSSQSVQSGISELEPLESLGPPSPIESSEPSLGLTPTLTKDTVKVDLSCQRPGEDMSAVEDGPLFRATMKALEQKTGSMRIRMKKVLKKAEAALTAQVDCNDAFGAFMEALKEASASNANAVQPALEHYFEKIAKQILLYEKQNTTNLQKMIIDPLSRIYNVEIKQAESKKKDFEDESRDYYAYVSRYLGQRQDSLKEKKRIESDSKYQSKRRNFELKRFDYSSFMQDLNGGRREQEVLSLLTKYADTQAKSYLSTAKKVEDMTPQLEALIQEVNTVDKEFQFQRTEREEKRRMLEKSTKTYVEPDVGTSGAAPSQPAPVSANPAPEPDLTRSDSVGRNGLHYSSSSASQQSASAVSNGFPASPSSRPTSGIQVMVSSDKFKGFRDLEEKDHGSTTAAEKVQHRKEGLLWALSRPGSHVDPKGLHKQAWHKFWIVLDQGKLSEYSNWKQRLDLHRDPIDLRLASVREARNAERRFCFEVITPHYKRVYQATSEEDMNAWMNALNNALQSAVEGRSQPQPIQQPSLTGERGHRDIGSVLTGKSSSYSGHNHHHHHSPPYGNNATNNVYRRTTVGARPAYVRTDSNSFEDNPSKLLQIVRDADKGNCWCADCGSGVKTEWVSINLGIVLCIECSGIHRSLGTHISKIRSLTLDITSFTTDIVELLLQVGNRVSNMVWEATLDQSLKPSPQASRDQRLQFITSKYINRAYVESISTTFSHFSTPEETLLASIKKNDIQGVLYALALRANPNATDRSRNTPVVFLALAAADPASPASTNTLTIQSSSSPRTAATKIAAFPVAELLTQNGASIPTTPPAFPLSSNAQLYIDQKSGKDTLGDLPVIRMVGGGGGGGGAISGGLNPGEREKEREAKLQKRGSAGGRLAGRPPGV